jgi:hypothetical protein
MKDPLLLVIIIRGVLSLLFIGAGIAALIIGWKLYVRGVGVTKDGTQMAFKRKKVTLKTVGSVVMATSVAWGYLAYLSLPRYKDRMHDIELMAPPPSKEKSDKQLLKPQDDRIKKHLPLQPTRKPPG